MITALGTGVLVGTSLIVIIPEGVETLYNTGDNGHSHIEQTSLAPMRRVAVPDVPHLQFGPRDAAPTPADVGTPASTDVGFVTGPDDGFSAGEKGDVQNAPAQDSKTGEGGPSDKETAPHGHPDPGHNDEIDQDIHHDPHAWVGISLIAGFILMYLIDILPQHATASDRPQRFSVSLNSLNFNRQNSLPNGSIDSSDQDTLSGSQHGHHSRPSSTTVGLVIHAAADGVALGASSTTSTSNLSFIIFIAIMIHKAPAAFGLTTVLLKQGLSKRAARAHLIIFSLAAPVGAIFTWSAAHLLGYGSSALGGTKFATGALLLFSGGTFLYVAMHTMQESGPGLSDHQGNDYAGLPMHEMYGDPNLPVHKQGPALLDTLVTVGGMLIPLLTQWGHVH